MAIPSMLRRDHSRSTCWPLFNIERCGNPWYKSHSLGAWFSCFRPAQLRPRIDWVVGLDFGTTYSGFAYARVVSDEPAIHVYYAWPQLETERPYSKTLTALFYKRETPEHAELEGASWGYCARTAYFNQNKKRQDPRGLYLTAFKVLLMREFSDALPPPLTIESLITDYLKCIGEQALSVIRNHEGEVNFNQDAVQWCVTVPSIWDAKAKQRMKNCMVKAGLVSQEAGGVDAVKIALEPEAASFHCHQILQKEQKRLSLQLSDKLLVLDVGGGTVDIVVQEFVGTSQIYKVKEITQSSGGFCGGTFVDQSFMRFLSQKIGCLEAFLSDFPSFKTRLLKDWEEVKCAFSHEMMDTDTVSIPLHYKLAPKWEAYENERGNRLLDSSEVELTKQDLQSIFDPMVEEILELIAAQLEQVPDIKVMFVVGGFASSPYLMQRIRARFAEEIAHIVSPPDPGSAVVHGAVSLALHPEAIVSNFRGNSLNYGNKVTRRQSSH